MAEKPKTNVTNSLRSMRPTPRCRRACSRRGTAIPAVWRIRDVMTEHVLLPVAEELGLPFTLKELRNYELLKWGRQHQDRELTEQDMAVDYETTYWLLDRGWSNDEAAFCGGEH